MSSRYQQLRGSKALLTFQCGCGLYKTFDCKKAYEGSLRRHSKYCAKAQVSYYSLANVEMPSIPFSSREIVTVQHTYNGNMPENVRLLESSMESLILGPGELAPIPTFNREISSSSAMSAVSGVSAITEPELVSNFIFISFYFYFILFYFILFLFSILKLKGVPLRRAASEQAINGDDVEMIPCQVKLNFYLNCFIVF